jgi:acetyl-CoA carboxylase alpha subunit
LFGDFLEDRKHSPEAAEALKLTADDLSAQVVDEVVPNQSGAHRDHDLAAANLGKPCGTI